jgi:hypothetical protein
LETEILYTFSTIAQVLATMIALLGAFLVFKLQSMHSAMMLERSSLLDRSLFSEEEILDLNQWRGYGEFQQFIILVNKKVDAQFAVPGVYKKLNYTPEWWATVLFMRGSVNATNELRRRLSVAMGVTAVTLVYSIAALIFAPTFAHHPTWVALRILGFVGCVALYVRVIRFAMHTYRDYGK